MKGIELDSEVLIQTQQNIIGQQAVQIAQLEAAVQQLARLVPTDKEESHVPIEEAV